MGVIGELVIMQRVFAARNIREVFFLVLTETATIVQLQNKI